VTREEKKCLGFAEHTPFEKHATVLQKFQSSVVIFQFQSKWKSFHHSKHGLNSKKGMGS